MAIVRSGRLVKQRRSQSYARSRPASAYKGPTLNAHRHRVQRDSIDAHELNRQRLTKASKAAMRLCVLFWKRCTRPCLPRRNLRFSFIPDGFHLLDVAAETKTIDVSVERRWAGFWDFDLDSYDELNDSYAY